MIRSSPSRIKAWDRRRAAIHEAAHLIMARRYGLKAWGKISRPYGANVEIAGQWAKTWVGQAHMIDVQTLSPLRRLRIAIAGFIAECLLEGDDGTFTDEMGWSLEAMSDSDWHLSGYRPDLLDGHFMKATRDVGRYLETHWHDVRAMSRVLIIKARNEGAVSPRAARVSLVS